MGNDGGRRFPLGLVPNVRETASHFDALVQWLSSEKVSIYKLYQRAVGDYLRNASVQADDDADDGPGKRYCGRFKYKTPRTGQQYFDTQYIFKRDWERRRDNGAGRRRQAAPVREALMMWYNIIRHSVDVKLMVRFPKQVLLVKAHELYRQYLRALIFSTGRLSTLRFLGNGLINCSANTGLRTYNRIENTK